MTPFDGYALYVMLLTFYPACSVAALRRALLERPDYFAGGVLVSTSGEKLELPDGRIFDLIYDVDGFSGGPKWQVIEAGPPGPPDPFPLEAGPLLGINADLALPPAVDAIFESLVSSHLAQVATTPDVIGALAGELVAAGDAAGADAVYEGSARAAERALEDQIRGFDDLNPGTGSANAGGLGGQIADAQQDYPDPETQAPPDITVDPEPRNPPPHEGPDSPWYQQ